MMTDRLPCIYETLLTLNTGYKFLRSHTWLAPLRNLISRIHQLLTWPPSLRLRPYHRLMIFPLSYQIVHPLSLTRLFGSGMRSHTAHKPFQDPATLMHGTNAKLLTCFDIYLPTFTRRLPKNIVQSLEPFRNMLRLIDAFLRTH